MRPVPSARESVSEGLEDLLMPQPAMANSEDTVYPVELKDSPIRYFISAQDALRLRWNFGLDIRNVGTMEHLEKLERHGVVVLKPCDYIAEAECIIASNNHKPKVQCFSDLSRVEQGHLFNTLGYFKDHGMRTTGGDYLWEHEFQL